MIAVADAGPLIALAKISALSLLRRLYQTVYVTPAVLTEAVTAGLAQNAPDAGILNDAVTGGQLQVRTPTLAALPIPSLLHLGEDESLRLALEIHADLLLIDDLAARQIALANIATAGASTSIKGTLGVIITAYQQHLLSQQAGVNYVAALKARPDVWISRDLCDRVIRLLQAVSP